MLTVITRAEYNFWNFVGFSNVLSEEMHVRAWVFHLIVVGLIFFYLQTENIELGQ